MSMNDYRDMVPQDAVPLTTIEHDIAAYIRDSFVNIREQYNLDPPTGIPLTPSWPDTKDLQILIERTVPLFIAAATVCRFVGDADWDPCQRLEQMLTFPSIGHLEQMEQTYLPVLTQWACKSSESRDHQALYQDFRTIVGTIINLGEPLSQRSLGLLLDIPSATIALRLRPLHSVLQIPNSPEAAVQTLHFSFSEFLLSENLRGQPYSIDGPATHEVLSRKCLKLLSGPDGLRENICSLDYPGQIRQEIKQATIDNHVSPVVRYACRYWIYHVQYSKVTLRDGDDVCVFLQKHFLHWLEALSLIDRLAEAIDYLSVLKALLSVSWTSTIGNREARC